MSEEDPAAQHWTVDLRRQIWSESEKNLFFFCRAVLGYKDITDTHRELCECLDGRGDWGDWRRGVIGCHRGWIKTSIVRAWALREALHKVNWSMRYLGSTFENASLHFLQPIKNFFLESERSPWAKFLYGHRLPAGYAGWTDRQVVFLRTDANAPPALSIKGIGSDQEGYHGNAIAIDDPEGAESEKSEISQVDAIRSVGNATPLLINPGNDRILLIGTVHGADPVVYRALYENFNIEEASPRGEVEWDNSKRVWKQFWRPIYGADGKPVFSHSADGSPRFTEDVIEVIRRGNLEMWKKQYLLLRTGQGTSNWSRKIIEKNFAEWKKTDSTAEKDKVVRYRAVKVDMKKWKDTGKMELSEVWRECRASEMFYYLGLDPKHKEFTTSYQRAKVRPSAAAAVLIGVSPDNHLFLLRRWMKKEASLEDQIETVLNLHLEWGARKFVLESIGAQAWFGSILRIREDSNPIYSNPYATSVWGEKRWLPRLSSLVEEDKRTPKMDKEEHIYHRLDPLIAEGRLHTFADQDDANDQLIGFPDSTEYVDLIDAMAMVVPYVSPPLGTEEQQRAREEQRLLREIGKQYASYDSPLRRKRHPRRQTHPGYSGRLVDFAKP